MERGRHALEDRSPFGFAGSHCSWHITEHMPKTASFCMFTYFTSRKLYNHRLCEISVVPRPARRCTLHRAMSSCETFMRGARGE